MAAWAVTHGDRFKAAIAGAAPADMAAIARITARPISPPAILMLWPPKAMTRNEIVTRHQI